ncbi:transposase [Streptomyces sp. NPDC051183]|uniref:transposase n=1 Tax=Streptomyces sp. NPDC051183 TaxID=3155165 RepID=UPI00342732E1
MIIDRHSAHRSKTVQAWLAGRQDEIELHFLPSCSPEPNPDELVNADLKRSLPYTHRARNQAELRVLLTPPSATYASTTTALPLGVSEGPAPVPSRGRPTPKGSLDAHGVETFPRNGGACGCNVVRATGVGPTSTHPTDEQAKPQVKGFRGSRDAAFASHSPHRRRAPTATKKLRFRRSEGFF